jgi:hypothetical protein
VYLGVVLVVACGSPRGPPPLPDGGAGRSGGRVRAAAQHGHRGWQPAACPFAVIRRCNRAPRSGRPGDRLTRPQLCSATLFVPGASTLAWQRGVVTGSGR